MATNALVDVNAINSPEANVTQSQQGKSMGGYKNHPNQGSVDGAVRIRFFVNLKRH
jgi:hypothetical protein